MLLLSSQQRAFPMSSHKKMSFSYLLFKENNGQQAMEVLEAEKWDVRTTSRDCLSLHSSLFPLIRCERQNFRRQANLGANNYHHTPLTMILENFYPISCMRTY